MRAFPALHRGVEADRFHEFVDLGLSRLFRSDFPNTQTLADDVFNLSARIQ